MRALITSVLLFLGSNSAYCATSSTDTVLCYVDVELVTQTEGDSQWVRESFLNFSAWLEDSKVPHRLAVTGFRKMKAVQDAVNEAWNLKRRTCRSRRGKPRYTQVHPLFPSDPLVFDASGDSSSWELLVGTSMWKGPDGLVNGLQRRTFLDKAMNTMFQADYPAWNRNRSKRHHRKLVVIPKGDGHRVLWFAARSPESKHYNVINDEGKNRIRAGKVSGKSNIISLLDDEARNNLSAWQEAFNHWLILKTGESLEIPEAE